MDKLYGEQKDDYRIYDILGDDDFRLIARNVSLGRLLQEYVEGGLLDNHGEQVRLYFFQFYGLKYGHAGAGRDR